MNFTLNDQMGRELVLPTFPPRRIVSLVPSQTELLFDLGLDETVVGITRFCIYPPHWYKSKVRVGGTKDCTPARILALQPDLILANKEENVQETIVELAKNVSVWVSDIETLTDAHSMIQQVAQLTDRIEQGQKIIAQIYQSFEQIPCLFSKRVAYLIWRNPYMAVGSNTFIHNMLCTVCGMTNVFAHCPRYPVIEIADLIAAQPDLVLLSSEPYPFKAKHIAELQAHLPNAHIVLTDGEMFSWYGSRLILAGNYLSSFLVTL